MFESVTCEDGKRKNGTSYLAITPRKADHGQEYECRAMNEALLEAKFVRASLNVQCK